MTDRYERAREAVRLNASQAESADQAQALREALEDTRSRSSIDVAMRSNPFELTARLSAIYQIADAALSNGEAEMSDRRLTTHGPGCWSWGLKHYECAVRRVERLEEALRESRRVAWLCDPLVRARQHPAANSLEAQAFNLVAKIEALLRDQEGGLSND